MARLPPYPIFNWSGGVRNDKSDYTKENSELVDILNYDIDEQGRLKKRLGGFQFGDTESNGDDIINSTLWQFQTLGSTPSSFHIIATNASTSGIYRIVGNRLNGAITTATTTITVISTNLFDSSGTIEIDGDVITYTGKTGTTFTGCTGISANHADGTAVHQLDALSGTSVNGNSGVYFTTLNNLLFINGTLGSSTFNGTSMSAVSDTDEPDGIFATTYRQRIYVAGGGGADGSGSRNGNRNRVAFSEAGDATDWGDYTVNIFDVEDTFGEQISGLKVSINDELLIWKQNSFFAYNEVRLHQRSSTVGAYNHFVVQEIDGLLYTFCPSGVHVTNGQSTQRISDPVADYIKDFVPQFDSGRNRVVTNTFAAVHDKKYILYIQDITKVDSLSDVLLVYDTVVKRWTVYQGLTNFTHLIGMGVFKTGNVVQGFEGLFGGDSSGKYYRLLSKRYIDTIAAGTKRFFMGGDIFTDVVSDTSLTGGAVIRGQATTKFLDLDAPQEMKQIRKVRGLAETPGHELLIRCANEFGEKTDWIHIGKMEKTNQLFHLPKEARGYRVQFRVVDSVTTYQPVFNGIIVEEAETVGKPTH